MLKKILVGSGVLLYAALGYAMDTNQENISATSTNEIHISDLHKDMKNVIGEILLKDEFKTGLQNVRNLQKNIIKKWKLALSLIL